MLLWSSTNNVHLITLRFISFMVFFEEVVVDGRNSQKLIGFHTPITSPTIMTSAPDPLSNSSGL